MAVLMDTRDLPSRESAAAVHAALNTATSPVLVTAAQGIHAVIEGWQLGAGANVLHSTTNGAMTLRRTKRHLRIDAPERLSLASSLHGEYRARQRQTYWKDDSALQLLDLTTEYESRWDGPSVSVAFQVDYADLGMPVDLIRAATPLVRASALHDLTMHHLRQLPAIAGRMTSGPALTMLGSATTDLVRALVASVIPDSPRSRQAREQTMLTVLLTYIDHHLHDPGLTPARIAAVHSISLRQLYRLFVDLGETPAEVILRRRLDGAHRELATRAAHRSLIAATARRWGFTDPRHFARRFRATYGVTPSAWVQHHLTNPT